MHGCGRVVDNFLNNCREGEMSPIRKNSSILKKFSSMDRYYIRRCIQIFSSKIVGKGEHADNDDLFPFQKYFLFRNNIKLSFVFPQSCMFKHV